MIFQDPWILMMLPLLVAIVFFSTVRKKPAIRFSSDEFFKNLKPSIKLKLSRNLVSLRALALVLVIFALARPQSPIEMADIRKEGVDIVLAVDVSTSMLAEDFTLGTKRANRLEVVKDVIKDFIKNRHSDRIGMVVFAARAYTVSPLTLDYSWLLQNLERVNIGMIEDGTAVGSGVASALNRLKDTEAKDKVVILLTDGRNNAGRISPLTAAEAAEALGIKVYTIGAGTKGRAPYPIRDVFGRKVYRAIKIEIDEDTLINIASKTKAKYFRATDTENLREIYKEIDKLEKTPIEEKGYLEYKELFYLFLIPGLLLLALEIVLGNTVLRSIP